MKALKQRSLLLVISICLLVSLIMLLQAHGSQRWDRTLQNALLTLDQISQAQQASSHTRILVEQVVAGERSLSPDQVQANLQNARIYSQQISEGIQRLNELQRHQLPGPALQQAAAHYQTELQRFDQLLQQRLQAPQQTRQLDLQVSSRQLNRAASQLELAAYDSLHQLRSHQRWLDALNILLTGLLTLILLAILGYNAQQRSRDFRQVQASEARLRAFTSNQPGIAFLFDAEGNYLDVYGNARQQLYQPGDGLRGCNLTEVLPDALARRCLAGIHRALDEGCTQILHYDLLLHGQRLYFEARLAPIPNRRQVAWTSWDITARHLADCRIRELSRMYGLLRAANQAIVQCDDRHSLFSALCSSALEQRLFSHASLQPMPATAPADWPEGLWQRLHSGEILCLQAGADIPAAWHSQEAACWFILPAGLEHPPTMLLRLGSLEGAMDRPEIHGLLGELRNDLEYALQRFALRQQTRLQREHLAMMAAALESSQDAILITDSQHHTRMANPAFCQRTGQQAADCQGQSPLQLYAVQAEDGLFEQLEHSGAWQGEVLGHDRHGAPLPALLSITRMSGGEHPQSGFIYCFTDLRRLKQTEELLDTLTWFDTLTGLPNATRLWLELDERLYREQTEEGSTAVLFINLHDFHSINDAYGHSAGDELLRLVGQRLSQHFGLQACVGRHSGDTFVALVPVGDAQQVPGLAHAVQQALQAPFSVGEHEPVIGCSIGIALSGQDADQAGELLHCADVALHDARNAGRNQWRSYAAETGDLASQRLGHEALLRRALNLELFELHYQPLLDCRTGQLHGAEALVRLQADAGCKLGPADFIPLLEQSGMILQLGEWVQREACRQCRQWLDAGLDPGVIAINLSTVEVQDGRVRQQLQAILAETGLPARHIELEVTESGLLTHGPQATGFLQELHDLGVKLAIDDFGTGYSSLAYLKHFPVDKLKIDRSFVRDLPDDAVDGQLTSTIISLARSLGLKVLAEGVETEAQRQYLSAAGCDYWQGYLASKPLPPAEFAARFLHPA